MAAFRARRFVWLAISLITWMISPICVELVLISSMASIDFCTAAPPCSARPLVCLAILSASTAFSLTDSTLWAISSIEALISSTLELCSWAPLARLWRAFGDHAGPFGKLVGALADLPHRRTNVLDDQVDVVPQFAVGARVLGLDRLREILGGHPLQDLGDILDGGLEAVQGIVHAGDDRAVLALVFRGVGPRGQSPLVAALESVVASSIRPLMASMHWLRLLLMRLKSPL